MISCKSCNSVATKLRRSSFFKDFWPKTHLRLRPISKSRRIFEASKILGRRFRRYFRKNHLLLKKFWGKMEENRSVFWIENEKNFWCPKFSSGQFHQNFFHNTYRVSQKKPIFSKILVSFVQFSCSLTLNGGSWGQEIDWWWCHVPYRWQNMRQTHT